YGSRGANGVILITTHKGAQGSPARYMCMPAIAFGGELQMWAYLSGKTAGEKMVADLETL
ncbi:MAG: hypothetical protein KHY83_07140, partial [Coriobacteriia bacterium]|nr:hypothetical protein [Coriobacteriia bacterium]